MKRFILSLLLFTALGIQSGVAQKFIYTEYPYKTPIIINDSVYNPSGTSVLVQFSDSVELKLSILIEGKKINKYIKANESRKYTLVKTSDNNYCYRLRENLTVNDLFIITADQLPPIENVNIADKNSEVNQSIDSKFLSDLSNNQFQFERTQMLLDYLNRNSVSNEQFVLYVKTLDHEFTRWQIIEQTYQNSIINPDYKILSGLFSSAAYLDKLKLLLNE
ncbi:MAG: hypothetical protein N4A46_05085 [Schleiferiaceae bacterium]|jgi:hypothetical protein|nr:hypothetical protein [Schleiferiaceae bacterium]